ncbi:MAG: hypothetical protein IJE49_09715 [Agathobacter sp.]|nr:hypothetical protein [Agathobacter sp.]
MSVCTFIASDSPLREVSPEKDYPLEINLDNGTINDGGADDNFYLLTFENLRDYTDKTYGVYLEWNYTDGRAEQIIKYIKEALKETDSKEIDDAEIWNKPDKQMPSRPSFYRLIITR